VKARRLLLAIALALGLASASSAQWGRFYNPGSGGGSGGTAGDITAGTTTITSGTANCVPFNGSGVFTCSAASPSWNSATGTLTTGTFASTNTGEDAFFQTTPDFSFYTDTVTGLASVYWESTNGKVFDWYSKALFSGADILSPGGQYLESECDDAGAGNGADGYCFTFVSSTNGLLLGAAAGGVYIGTSDAAKQWKFDVSTGHLTAIGAARNIDTNGGTITGVIAESTVTNLVPDLANLAAQIGSQTAPPGTQSAVLSGSCGVNWSGTGLVYNVSACQAYIAGTLYSAAATNITLTAADASNARIDAIVVNTSAGGTIAKVDGTAAASPTTPAIDTTTQLVLAYIQVDANVSTPTGASNEIIHDGTDTSAWTCTAGTGWTCNSTGNPHSGTKDVLATAVASNAFTKFVRSSTITLDAYQQMSLWIAPGSGTWANGRQLQVTIRNANGQQIGTAVTISNGAFGFVRTSTAYQLIVLPIGLFHVPAQTAVKEVRLNPAGSGGTFTFTVDDLEFQSNTNTLLPAGSAYSTLYLDANGVPTGTGPGTSGLPLKSQGTASPPIYGTIAEAAIATTDVTTDNVTSTKHGFAPKAPADATQFLNGAATAAFAQVKDSDLSTSDVTTNDATTSKHGFLKKPDNDTTHFMRGDASWSVIPPIVWWLPFAGCQNTTAFLLWDSPTSNPAVAACITGTNTQKGVADFDASTDQSLQYTARLPAQYSGGSIDARVVWLAAATSGSAGWCVQLIKVSDAATDDPAFPAQASGNCTSDAAKGTTLQTNVATISGVTCSSCAGGDLLHIKLSRDADGSAVTDDMTGNGRAIGLELTIPR